MREKKNAVIAAAVTPSIRRAAEAAARREGVTLSRWAAEILTPAARAELATCSPESRPEPAGVD